MREVERLSMLEWRGHWHTAGTLPGGSRDGYRDYTGVVPVIVTVLGLLEEHGPHGPIWWRYGRKSHEILTDALANPDDYSAYSVREDRRGAADERSAGGRSRNTRRSAGAGRPQRGAAWSTAARPRRSTAAEQTGLPFLSSRLGNRCWASLACPVTGPVTASARRTHRPGHRLLNSPFHSPVTASVTHRPVVAPGPRGAPAELLLGLSPAPASVGGGVGVLSVARRARCAAVGGAGGVAGWGPEPNGRRSIICPVSRPALDPVVSPAVTTDRPGERFRSSSALPRMFWPPRQFGLGVWGWLFGSSGRVL